MDERVANVFLAVQMGAEVGLTPMQAIQSIAVINNRPSLWGDGLIGVVRASGVCGFITETIEGEGASRTAWCETRRTDNNETVKRSFSWADAEKANLTGKGPWKSYPNRMLAMRARSWCLRDAYPDVLKGLHSADELADHTGTLVPQGDGSYSVAPAERPKKPPPSGDTTYVTAEDNEGEAATDDLQAAGHQDLDKEFADTVGDPEPREPADATAAEDAATTTPATDAPGVLEDDESFIARTTEDLATDLEKTDTVEDLLEFQATFDATIFRVEDLDKAAASQLDQMIQTRFNELRAEG